MKHFNLQRTIIGSLLTFTILVSPVFAAAAVDQNLELKKEFAKDVPTSYSDAIKNGMSGNISATASVTTPIAPVDAQFTFSQSDQDQVRVVYMGHALLFGFLPVPIEIEAAVDASGQVRIALPWYRFALRSEDSATVENSISTTIQAQTTLPSPDNTLSQHEQDLLMKILKDTLPLHFTQAGLINT
ncbi:MAG: hypothetical protein WCG20_01835 [bacterium]